MRQNQTESETIRNLARPFTAALLVTALACAADPREDLPESGSATTAAPERPLICPSEVPRPGGLIIGSNPKVVHIYEGGYWNYQPGAREQLQQTSTWNQLLGDPRYFAPLGVYGVVGPEGAPVKAYVDMSVAPGTLLSEASIQAIVENYVATESYYGLPPDDPTRTVYVVYLAPGILESGAVRQNPVTKLPDPTLTPSEFAHHNVFTSNAHIPSAPNQTRPYYYAVIPYLTASYPGSSVNALLAVGSSTDGTLLADGFGSADVTESHELDEAFTDPDVRTGYTDFYGGGEIGDVCNQLPTGLNGWSVQKVWSNAACACLDRVPQGPLAPPTGCEMSCASQTVGGYIFCQNRPGLTLVQYSNDGVTWTGDDSQTNLPDPSGVGGFAYGSVPEWAPYVRACSVSPDSGARACVNVTARDLYHCLAAPTPKPACTPKTCSSYVNACGVIDDGCGNLIDCGPCPCPTGQVWDGTQCVPKTCAPKTCSTGAYWDPTSCHCVRCSPTTCS
jgi:hypothetical protein